MKCPICRKTLIILPDQDSLYFNCKEHGNICCNKCVWYEGNCECPQLKFTFIEDGLRIKDDPFFLFLCENFRIKKTKH